LQLQGKLILRPPFVGAQFPHLRADDI
jgi:hypothetical protein